MSKGALQIFHGGAVLEPVTLSGVEWETERKGVPGKLTFRVLRDDKLNIAEGDAVAFRYGGRDVFYGFIFALRESKDKRVEVTAYDQLRYLKNKETYVYENKTAGELLFMIAGDFQLRLGAVDDPGFVIDRRVEDNQTLFDIMSNALDLTLMGTGRMYVLYDDFGALCLRDVEALKASIVLRGDTATDFILDSNIDEETYNRVKLYHDDDDTGKREVFLAQSGETINRWGVLQYTQSIDDPATGAEKAESLLSLYNAPKRVFEVSGAFGDVSVRGGSLIPVALQAGGREINNYMMVQHARHVFEGAQHSMTLQLEGAWE